MESEAMPLDGGIDLQKRGQSVGQALHDVIVSTFCSQIAMPICMECRMPPTTTTSLITEVVIKDVRLDEDTDRGRIARHRMSEEDSGWSHVRRESGPPDGVPLGERLQTSEVGDEGGVSGEQRSGGLYGAGLGFPTLVSTPIGAWFGVERQPLCRERSGNGHRGLLGIRGRHAVGRKRDGCRSPIRRARHETERHHLSLIGIEERVRGVARAERDRGVRSVVDRSSNSHDLVAGEFEDVGRTWRHVVASWLDLRWLMLTKYVTSWDNKTDVPFVSGDTEYRSWPTAPARTASVEPSSIGAVTPSGEMSKSAWGPARTFAAQAEAALGDAALVPERVAVPPSTPAMRVASCRTSELATR